MTFENYAMMLGCSRDKRTGDLCAAGAGEWLADQGCGYAKSCCAGELYLVMPPSSATLNKADKACPGAKQAATSRCS